MVESNYTKPPQHNKTQLLHQLHDTTLTKPTAEKQNKELIFASSWDQISGITLLALFVNINTPLDTVMTSGKGHHFATEIPHLGEICKIIFQHHINVWTVRKRKVPFPLSIGNPFPDTGGRKGCCTYLFLQHPWLLSDLVILRTSVLISSCSAFA